ncbi:MAG: hypothetical protein OSJ73_20940, partial [Lachnospiraceae bacterium]|nr:hypothetical protein [Lachnospiraceae bacterium]
VLRFIFWKNSPSKVTLSLVTLIVELILCYNSHQRQILHRFTNIRYELQQWMHTQCLKTSILALDPTPYSKCMTRV